MAERAQLEAYDLTNWLVGPYEEVNPAVTTEGELAAWQIPYHEIALGALRGVAATANIPEGWMPQPHVGAELFRDLAGVRKAHHMIGSLKAYVADEPPGSALGKFRANQHDMIGDIASAFGGKGFSDSIKVKSPTGSGKTAVIVGLTEGLKYKEQPNDEAGVLILVPRKDILCQTVRAFDRFSKRIRPSTYFGEKKELGPVTIMTYQSFNRAMAERVLRREMFQAVICDESHRAAGKRTAQNLHYMAFGGGSRSPMAVFELSATPKAEQDELTHHKKVTEGISQGLLSPVAARRVQTTGRIQEKERFIENADFATSEVVSLIDDEARNQLIVNEAYAGLASGRRTIIRCLPGDSLRHTEVIKEMLTSRKVEIKNPYMGDIEYRRPRVVVISGGMSMRQRKIIYEGFTENLNIDLDVLLFVETLVEGWDGPIAKKLINASPTRSARVIEQLFGRVLRPYERRNGEVVTAEAVDLIDFSQSGQVSFDDILTRDGPADTTYRNGVVVGKNLANYNDPHGRPYGAYKPVEGDEV